MVSYTDGGGDILNEEDALGLDDEEVDELMEVASHCVKGLARNRVVSARAELGGQAVAQDKLAGKLGSDGSGQSHPGELEAPSNDVEVSCGDNDGDD